MSPQLRHLALALFVALGLAPMRVAQGQSVMFGALSGRVVDGAGVPVSDAEVRAVDQASRAERMAITARDGRFSFSLMVAGSYDVSAEAIGYRPVVHTGVSLAPGGEIALILRVAVAAPPVTRIDTVAARARTAEPLVWLGERGYAELVGGRRLLSDVWGLSPLADATGVEGLPWRLTDATIDGARMASVGHMRSPGLETAALGAPLRGMARATAGGLGFDTEVGGTGVGLRATSARGGGATTWNSVLEGGTSNLGGGFALGGALQRDTAYALIGADYQQSEVAPAPWFAATDAVGLQLASIAQTSHGTDLSVYAAETAQLEQRWSAWGRFDWQQGDRLAVTLRTGASRLTRANPPLIASERAALGSRYQATAAQLALNILARLSPRFSGELRVSGDVGDARAEDPLLPSTVIAERGLALGGAPEESFEEARNTPRVSAMLHGAFGAHRLKAGVAVASHRIDSRMNPFNGEFRFGDAVDFAALDGAWYATDPSSSTAFRMTERAIFVQDVWRVTSGLEVALGLRSDAMRYPNSSIDPNSAWVAASGIDLAGRDDSYSRVSPRLGFRWDLGSEREWVLEGGAGTFTDLPDRRDLAEALTFDRGVTARYGVGSLGSWPNAPSAAAAPAVGTTLSLLGPDYEGPRTRRGSLRLLRSFGTWSAYVSGVYRHTDLLTRRRDLNLPELATGSDQDARPLYGTVRQVGTLLVAEPGSNRRFAGFDAAYALEATGYSEFSAFSVGLDRVVERGVSIALNYTNARTTDNISGFSGAEISPFPGGLAGSDWSEGRGDGDAPHRLLAALDWRAGEAGAVRFGAVYRLRSGDAFTPGFRAGVDANADGLVGNDPAFVNPALPGMTTLLGAWSCLERQSGMMAGRNSCRSDWAHTLDLRATFAIADFRGGRVSLVIDALDILAAPRGPVDRALMLVDRTGAITTNALTGVSTLPLIVNPNFGELLADRSPGILWRVGLRIGQ